MSLMCLWPDEDFHQQLNRIWKSMLVHRMSRILKLLVHNCWHQYPATRSEDTSLYLNIQSEINVQPANNTTDFTFRRLLLQTASPWWTVTRVNYRHFSGFLLSHLYLPILGYFPFAYPILLSVMILPSGAENMTLALRV